MYKYMYSILYIYIYLHMHIRVQNPKLMQEAGKTDFTDEL